jgi:RND family efflux transporter MFP subunit
MSQTLPLSAPKRKTPVRAIAGTILAIAVGGGIVANQMSKKVAAGGPPTEKSEHLVAVAAPAEVGVETVLAGSLMEPIRVTGELRTDEEVTISTKATGLVKQVYAKEGDRVSRGQLLVELDGSELIAQRDRAVAAVRAAEAQVAESEAAVKVAEAKAQQARTNTGIKDTGALSEQRRAEQALATAKVRLSQAKSQAGITGAESDTRVAGAKAAVQAARERLSALKEGSRRQEKAAAEAAVNRAQTQVARMKSMLDRREQLLRDKAIAAEVVDNARRDLEASQADLDAARQQLSLAEEGPRGEEIRAQEEVVRQAEAALAEAEANRARRQISNEDVEAAKNAVQQAESALEAATANLAQKDVNQDEIRSTQAALSQARAAVLRTRAAANQARADVRYQDEIISQTRLYSPVNGIVTKRQVQTGAAVVQMRNELMTLVSADTLYFEATAPESALGQLQRGASAKVSLDAVPGKVFPGVLREIIPVATGTNRSVRLRISFPKPPTAVVGGFARAEIQGRSHVASVSVPRTALVSDEGQMAVFKVADGKAVRTPVTAGDPGGTGDRVPVTAGLRSGDTIVVEGAASLVDGQAITTKAAGSH